MKVFLQYATILTALMCALQVQGSPLAKTVTTALDSVKSNKKKTFAPELKHFEPVPDRWRDVVPPPYELNVQGHRFDPYNQNVLKGDFPVIGQSHFFILTASSETRAEASGVPTASEVSTASVNSPNFFGKSGLGLFSQNLRLSLELYKGNTAYRPRDYEIKVTGIMNFNYANARENNVLNSNVAAGTRRYDQHFALQELLVEKHLFDVSQNYDFVSLRAGIQPFNSDFRGFLFEDTNLGARLFGSLGSNRYQYNFAYFRMLEKDTNSQLNTIFQDRSQDVFLFNLYKQDFLTLGYTAQLSFHYNHDKPSIYVDDNGVPVRSPVRGTVTRVNQTHDVKAYYVGWTGDGHWGRFNLTHAFYQAFGTDTQNLIAGIPININAQMAALELSYDKNWMRFRTSAMYASGDSNPFDSQGQGFDTIVDVPFFAGGPFSYWNTQRVALLGLNVTGRQSLVPNLRPNKFQGQANFVNPGLWLFNVGWEAEMTPKTRFILNSNYLRFANTSSVSYYVKQVIANDIGIDWGAGVQYRPFLDNNAKIVFSISGLVPLQGFKDMFDDRGTQVAAFTALILTF